MSFLRFRPLTTALTLAVTLSSSTFVEAQLFGRHCNSCQTAAAYPVQQVASLPMQQVSYNNCNPCQQQVAYNPCAVCPQPQQIVYRTVPTTEYREVAQTVRKPIVETAYEDRQFTEYRTVYETKTAQIPTVSYQNVSECQTVQRDMGRWVSQQQCVNKVSPCQYDNSAGLLGMINRTRYQIRSAFTPNTITRRYYQPNVVAYNVPVTRQVAHRGMKTVSYQVARLEPHTVTKQVAVRKVRWEEEQQTRQVAYTTYRQVPIGTRTAFGGFTPFTDGQTTTTAAVPDPISRSADASTGEPTPVQKRTANSDDDKNKENKKGFNAFGPNGSNEPKRKSLEDVNYEHTVQLTHSPASSANPTTPSMIRNAGWRARATSPETSSPEPGSELNGPALQVVKATR